MRLSQPIHTDHSVSEGSTSVSAFCAGRVRQILPHEIAPVFQYESIEVELVEHRSSVAPKLITLSVQAPDMAGQDLLGYVAQGFEINADGDLFFDGHKDSETV